MDEYTGNILGHASFCDVFIHTASQLISFDTKKPGKNDVSRCISVDGVKLH